MDKNTLKKVLTAFCDPETEVDITNGTLMVQINEEPIIASIRQEAGDIIIREGDSPEINVVSWLVNRVARLQLLADRILQTIPENKRFVTPNAEITDELDDSTPLLNHHTTNALTETKRLVSRRPAFTSCVVYLTADAGEGKSTLINELARQQAADYKNKKTSWLLVPIHLGGRPFMRFDDIITGHLANRLRFPILYFDAFIELVKLGLIIPALDGFEETFVVNGSGDAYSAIGSLMAALDEQGTLLISARKAFFDYKHLEMQGRLLDSIGAKSVTFSRLRICRWNKDNFIEFAEKSKYNAGASLHKTVSQLLHNPNHALLTRAVLADQLITVAKSTENISDLISKLATTPNDFFPLFVDALIEREVSKWLDTKGEIRSPLLSLSEHRELLSMIALEMWLQSTESLKADMLELVAGVFCESKRKPAAISQQIHHRIVQHALIVPTDNPKNTFGFDHEEFRLYFLGTAIAAALQSEANIANDLAHTLRKGALPLPVFQAVESEIQSSSAEKMRKIINTLHELTRRDAATSFLHQNATYLLLRSLNRQKLGKQVIENCTFSADSLENISINDITFSNCIFHATSVNSSSFNNVVFEKCSFDRLDLNTPAETPQSGASFEECDFICIIQRGKEYATFDPTTFPWIIEHSQIGRITGTLPMPQPGEQTQVSDEHFDHIQRLHRCFLTRTHVTDLLIKTKFGKFASQVIDETIPMLLQSRIIYRDTYRGGGNQSIYRLNISVDKLARILSEAKGSSDNFRKIANALRAKDDA